MTWTQQIKDKAEQALDNWAEKYGETLLRALHRLTHRHDALSVLLTNRYGQTRNWKLKRSLSKIAPLTN